MIHEMKLQDVYFDMIKAGIKIYEGRLNDEKRQLIHVGDSITFKKHYDDETYTVEVIDLKYFSSFLDMCKNLPLDEIGFKNKSPEEVASVYHQFYSVEDEQKYGVVAIKIK